MKIYMNLYSNSRFIIDAESFELKELTKQDGMSIMSDNSMYSLQIVGYDKNKKEYKLIGEDYFNSNVNKGNKKKYLVKIIDSISEEFIKGYCVPDFKGLIQKAVEDVKEEDKKNKHNVK